MNPNMFRLAELIHEDRLAKSAEAREWAENSVPSHLRAWLRLALSKRLITWGEQLSAPIVPTEGRV
jgi:hypothetical protein